MNCRVVPLWDSRNGTASELSPGRDARGFAWVADSAVNVLDRSLEVRSPGDEGDIPGDRQGTRMLSPLDWGIDSKHNGAPEVIQRLGGKSDLHSHAK
jgi:hypothetical protein